MKIFSFGAAGFLAIASMSGQQASPQQAGARQALTRQAGAGFVDIGKALDSVSSYASRLGPMLEEARPKEWVAKGAPDTYITQWNSSLEQSKGLGSAAKDLAQHTDRLPDVLQLLFRIQSLEITTGSLEDGLRRYQNPALADLLSATRAEATPVREKLQQYALELAAEKDQQFQIVDREAQRCRQDLSREPPRTRTGK